MRKTIKSQAALTTVEKFVAAINAHDSRRIIASCTPSHVFIDSLGAKVTGLANLRQGWDWYFATFPDYRIEIRGVMSERNAVLLHGVAAGTHAASASKWRIPAAWRAKVRNGLVSEWQVYADNKSVYELLSRGV